MASASIEVVVEAAVLDVAAGAVHPYPAFYHRVDQAEHGPRLVGRVSRRHRLVSALVRDGVKGTLEVSLEVKEDQLADPGASLCQSRDEEQVLCAVVLAVGPLRYRQVRRVGSA